MRIVYRVEHKDVRIGCFKAEDLVERYEDGLYWNDRDHLRSMPAPYAEFGIPSSTIGKSTIFAFPCMESTMYWLNYRYRVALQQAGFVIGLYRIKKAYRISDCQVMFTRHTAAYMGDMPLVRKYKQRA